MIFKHSKN